MTQLGLLIVELLRRDGPMHTPAVCRALDRDYSATVPIMTALMKEGAIEVAGTAAKFGFKDVKSSAPVYRATNLNLEVVVAKKPHQGETSLPAPSCARPYSKRGKTNSGSGVIAGKIEIGRGYKWGSSRA